MSLKLYNTLTRSKEIFEPMTPGKVRMYVCGVTVYDKCHVGHARANVTFDIIYRYLKFLKYDVTYVRNFTDIDDKIIKRSNEQKIPWKDLTEHYILEFRQDMEKLGNEPPTLEPKATEHIPQMIALIENLITKDLAYTAGGDVFYRVRHFKSYGRLSGKNIEDLESGARVEVMEAKSDPLDFVLWKATKPGEPYWPSPWGDGRPGWHIECSAMSMAYLGESFDIHGGGRDLIFPHHENEIAQSEGVTEKKFSKYWLHNGFVNINTEKMSKSLGNFLTIQDILQEHDGEVLRAFLLSVHYSSPIDFTEQNLKDTAQSLERYYSTVKRVQEYIALVPENKSASKTFPPTLQETATRVERLLSSFQDAMDDDFNTALVQGHIFEAVRAMNKILDQHETQKPLWLNNLSQKFLDQAHQIYAVLGCFGTDAEGFFKRRLELSSSQTHIDETQILNLIEQRKQARLSKDFKRADEIRQELAEMNIILKDRPDGTTGWSIKT